MQHVYLASNRDCTVLVYPKVSNTKLKNNQLVDNVKVIVSLRNILKLKSFGMYTAWCCFHVKWLRNNRTDLKAYSLFFFDKIMHMNVYNLMVGTWRRATSYMYFITVIGLRSCCGYYYHEHWNKNITLNHNQRIHLKQKQKLYSFCTSTSNFL